MKVTEKLRDEKLVCSEYVTHVTTHIDRISETLDYSKDYMFDYFGFKTLNKSYLLQSDGEIIERPQDLWMRVAVGILETTSRAP